MPEAVTARGAKTVASISTTHFLNSETRTGCESDRILICNWFRGCRKIRTHGWKVRNLSIAAVNTSSLHAWRPDGKGLQMSRLRQNRFGCNG
ncbi:Uncharacterised protein [Vibrio cholerae]|nr:Uncharacterised protein [Vibrio cholerae]CSI58266.1 Uncharacterised protein [Vibrio cholerae]